MTPHDSMATVLDAASTALAGTLPGAINLVSTQRSADVPTDRLDAYVAQGWMRWAAGRLLVTTKGAAMRDAVIAREEALGPVESGESADRAPRLPGAETRRTARPRRTPTTAEGHT